MSQTDITVILTVYNQRPESIETSMRSVAAQTGCTYQLLVADDHSSESFEDEATALASELGISNFTYVRHPENVQTVRNILHALPYAEASSSRPSGPETRSTTRARWQPSWHSAGTTTFMPASAISSLTYPIAPPMALRNGRSVIPPKAAAAIETFFSCSSQRPTGFLAAASFSRNDAWRSCSLFSPKPMKYATARISRKP